MGGRNTTSVSQLKRRTVSSEVTLTCTCSPLFYSVCAWSPKGGPEDLMMGAYIATKCCYHIALQLPPYLYGFFITRHVWLESCGLMPLYFLPLRGCLEGIFERLQLSCVNQQHDAVVPFGRGSSRLGMSSYPRKTSLV